MSRKEYVALVKIKNNLILSRILEQFPNVAQFCKQHNLSQMEVGRLVNMKEPAMRNDGSWSMAAWRLADALCEHPSELFTEEQAQADLERNEAYIEMTRQQALAMSDPMIELENKDEVRALMDIAKLSEKERLVLSQRFENDETKEGIGKSLGVTGNRINQIEEKALRKLRHATIVIDG